MDWYETVFELIDMRSFSNLWYWIAIAVLWSSVSHWVLGVPFDMIVRARREEEGEAMQDLQDMVRVNVNRILYIAEVSGSWILLFGSAIFTALFLMAILYDNEFSQALLFLGVPLVPLAFMSLATARRIRREALTGAGLIRRLTMHRFATQLVGVFAIFFTAMFGMYQNLYTGIVPF